MSAEQEETINPEYQGTGANTGSRSSGKKSGGRRKPTGFTKWFWIIVATIMGIWVVVPETELFIGPLGLIDDGVAAMVLAYALSQLGVRIPILERLTGIKSDKENDPEAKNEKNLN